MLGRTTLLRKVLPFTVLALLISVAIYRVAFHVPSPIIGN